MRCLKCDVITRTAKNILRIMTRLRDSINLTVIIHLKADNLSLLRPNTRAVLIVAPVMSSHKELNVS